MNTYRELIVWRKSINLVTEIYSITSDFPKTEQFGLISQIRRSAVSVPSNIAEGFGRNSKNEFIRFLNISVGSLFELQTQIEISKNLSFIPLSKFETFSASSLEIEKMLKALIKSIKK